MAEAAVSGFVLPGVIFVSCAEEEHSGMMVLGGVGGERQWKTVSKVAREDSWSPGSI